MKVVIIGAGGHGQVVADILRAARRRGGMLEVIGFLDDDRRCYGHTFLESKVLGSPFAIDSIVHDGSIVAIGDNRGRAEVFGQLVPANTSSQQLAQPLSSARTHR